MPGLLYYVPKLKHAKAADLEELGLAYAFGKSCSTCVCLRGPDSGEGVVLADSKRVEQIGYLPESQEWLKIPGHPAGAWVGRSTDKPVLPADLERELTLPGHPVTLADGQEWLVPVARGLSEQDEELGWYTAVPQVTGLDEQGEWTRGAVVARYAPIWEAACRWWDAIEGSTTEETEETEGERLVLDFAGRNDAAVVVLESNYRLGRAEVALLGLFDDDAPAKVLCAACDWPTLKEWVKKKEEAPEAAD